ncbi:MAG TPA: cupin domain-containing protein [Hyphomicrobiaceae bacterium]|nr:cupin domain-containing protein [Hyphomicrobiaceae bacterium]
MELNADFAKRAVEHSAWRPWQPSPMAGVDRIMLDRIGGEVARATTIVRYAAGSRFSPHVHGGGEEFLVLDGVFQDEDGDYPAGNYVRNPPGSRHTPRSDLGCTIFVKLWQFDPADRAVVRIDTARAASRELPGRPKVSVQPLFNDAREDVRIETWAPGAEIAYDPVGGLELLVLEGAMAVCEDALGARDWLRLPIGMRLEALAGSEGCRFWVKEGHLRFAKAVAPGTRG